jgi:hypothetical protein
MCECAAMRRSWLILLVLLAWWPRSALAFEFTDSAGDFHAKLEAAGTERVCIAVPAGHTDPVGCEGYDTSGFGKLTKDRAAATVIGAAFITDGDEQLMVVITRSAETASSTDFETQGSAMEKGLEIGQKGSIPGVQTRSKDHKVVTIANREALQVDIDLDMPEDAATKKLFGHTRYIIFPSGNVDYVIATSSSLKNASRTNALSERVLGKTAAKASTKHTSKAFKQGAVIGVLVGMVVLVLVIVGVIVLVTRRKAAPVYGAWGPGWQQQRQWPPYQPGMQGPPPMQGPPGQGPGQAPPAQDPGAFYSIRPDAPPGDPPKGV